MAARPRLRFVATLGVHAGADDARRILADALGFSEVSADKSHVAFANDHTAIFVDTTDASVDLPGFTPLFACDALGPARIFLEEMGCKTSPMPWSGPGLLVEGPGGLRFCVAQMVDVESDTLAHPGPGVASDSLQISEAFVEESWEEDETALGNEQSVHTVDIDDHRAADDDSTLATRAVSQEEINAVIARMESGDEETRAGEAVEPAVTELVPLDALASLVRAAGFELSESLPLEDGPHPSRHAFDLRSNHRLRPHAVANREERRRQPDTDDLEATAIRLSPGHAANAPSIVDPPDGAAPYSEFEIEDPTTMGPPTTSLLDRAGGRPDVTQLGAPPPGLLNRLARDDDGSPNPALASPSFSDFADDDDSDEDADTKHAAPPPEWIQDELLDAERRREREQQLRRVATSKKTAPTKTAPTKTAPTKTAPTKTAPTKTAPTKTAPTKTAPTKTAPTKTAPTKTAPTKTAPSAESSRRRPRPARDQVNSAAENILSHAAQFPVDAPEFDDDTARESPRARGLVEATFDPNLGIPLPDSDVEANADDESSTASPRRGGGSSVPRRPPARPRRGPDGPKASAEPSSRPAGGLLFGSDSEEGTATPVVVATEEIGNVFTETSDNDES